MNQVTVNGRTIVIPSGSSVSVINNQVYIDGKPYGPGDVADIIIEGNPSSVDAKTGSVSVKGSVHGDVRAAGSVNCGPVGGSVTAGGSVNAGNVQGKVSAGGSVNCSR